jgi:hypothetical protein
MVARTRDSCIDLFKILKILPLTSQYIIFFSPVCGKQQKVTYGKFSAT